MDCSSRFRSIHCWNSRSWWWSSYHRRQSIYLALKPRKEKESRGRRHGSPLKKNRRASSSSWVAWRLCWKLQALAILACCWDFSRSSSLSLSLVCSLLICIFGSLLISKKQRRFWWERKRKREESWRIHEPFDYFNGWDFLFLREGTEFMVVVPVSSATETCNGAVTEFRFTYVNAVGFRNALSFHLLSFFFFCRFWLPFKTILTQSFSFGYDVVAR